MFTPTRLFQDSRWLLERAVELKAAGKLCDSVELWCVANPNKDTARHTWGKVSKLLRKYARVRVRKPPMGTYLASFTYAAC